MPLPELPTLLAEISELTSAYLAGGPESFHAYRNLLTRLFAVTVMQSGGGLEVNTPSGDETRGVIAPLGSPLQPMPLTSGEFLRFNINLFLGETTKAPGTKALKVADENFQYQLDQPGNLWIFRYEYMRVRADRHPPAHLHVRAQLLPEVLSGSDRPLERIHFPTGRVSVPAIIRLLIEQFDVPSNKPPELWRPALARAESDFQRIAHQSLSGPGV